MYQEFFKFIVLFNLKSLYILLDVFLACEGVLCPLCICVILLSPFCEPLRSKMEENMLCSLICTLCIDARVLDHWCGTVVYF